MINKNTAETIASLGESIRSKIDKRGLRCEFPLDITIHALENDQARIEEEVLKPMEYFILLVRSCFSKKLTQEQIDYYDRQRAKDRRHLGLSER